MIHGLIVLALGLVMLGLGRAAVRDADHGALAAVGTMIAFAGLLTTAFGMIVIVWPGFAMLQPY